jgi:hypothetical protein
MKHTAIRIFDVEDEWAEVDIIVHGMMHAPN